MSYALDELHAPECGTLIFKQGRDICTQFDHLNDFFQRRASYHYKA